MPLLFDSHLDLAWNALSWKRDLLLPLTDMNRLDASEEPHKSRGRATVCLPELRAGRVAVCLATLMGRVPYGSKVTVQGTSLDFPRHENTYAFAHGQLAYYRILVQQNELSWIRTSADLRRHWQRWSQWPADATAREPIGMILAMEGADAICTPTQAEEWYDAGLRCVSLVHYGSSQYASGTGDEGPVTPAGFALLDELARLGMILDTTHLCDTSFFQALDHFGGVVLASHQNCRQLVPGQRQFSDEQIGLLLQRGGVLGIAFDAWMMYPGWVRGQTSRQVVSMAAAVDHIDHICQLAGNDQQVAIGSDLDGGFGNEQTPRDLNSIADLQKLADLLAARGFNDASVDRIMGANWFEFFCRHLPSGN